MASLLNGQVDFLQDPPLDQLNRLQNVPEIKLARAGALVTILLCPDQGSAELRTSDIKGGNPFPDGGPRAAAFPVRVPDRQLRRDHLLLQQVSHVASGAQGRPSGLEEGTNCRYLTTKLEITRMQNVTR